MSDPTFENLQVARDTAESRLAGIDMQRVGGLASGIALGVVDGFAVASEAAQGWLSQPEAITYDSVVGALAIAGLAVYGWARSRTPRARHAHQEAQDAVEQKLGLTPQPYPEAA